MSNTIDTRAGGGRRSGRPLLYSLTETAIFILVAVALIATAAIPAMVRHPHTALAQTVATASARR